MSKLLKLKEWLTVPDAAHYLSGVFREPVGEADVLRLALDGHLGLSVNFVNATPAIFGRLVPLADAERITLPRTLRSQARGLFSGKTKAPPLTRREGTFYGTARLMKRIGGTRRNSDTFPANRVNDLIGENRFLLLDEPVRTIDGVWDLPLVASERLDIEHRYQQLVGGPPVTLVCLDGPLVRAPDGSYALLQERLPEGEFLTSRLAAPVGEKRHRYRPRCDPRNHVPAGGLPEDCLLVVRTSALADFITRTVEAEGSSEPKKESPREKNMLLRIIGVMAHQKYSKDIGAPHTIAKHIKRKASEIGVEISDQTIAAHVRAALMLTSKSPAAS